MCRKLRPLDRVTSLNVSDDGHAAVLFIEARSIVLGRSPLYFGLYHIDELCNSFGAVKLLPIITLPDYRCRPFHRIGPTLARRVTMTEKWQLRDAVYMLEDTIREIRNELSPNLGDGRDQAAAV